MTTAKYPTDRLTPAGRAALRAELIGYQLVGAGDTDGTPPRVG